MAICLSISKSLINATYKLYKNLNMVTFGSFTWNGKQMMDTKYYNESKNIVVLNSKKNFRIKCPVSQLNS